MSKSLFDQITQDQLDQWWDELSKNGSADGLVDAYSGEADHLENE